MKLTNRFAPTQLIAAPWAVYGECAEVIGQILGNDFDREHHEQVYEHVRHSHDEMCHHGDEILEAERVPGLEDGRTQPEPLHDEEFDVYRAMLINEQHKRLNVIGDVGVGKSTFLHHLFDRHLGRDGFPGETVICLDWSDFTASNLDPMPAIERRFISRVLAELERKRGRAALRALDRHIFETAEMFSTDRLVFDAEADEDKPRAYAHAIRQAMTLAPLDYIHARLDALCQDDPNAIVLIIDNIDHLPAPVLMAMFSFLTALQVKTKPLLIVGMRDHTYIQGRSAYTPDRIAMAWRMRLNPPNLRGLMQRRIDYFFSSRFDDLVAAHRAKMGSQAKEGVIRRVLIGGMKHVDLDLKKVCRRLLDSTIADNNTREFIFSYANYNIRDLFANLQRVLSCPGYGAFDARIVMDQEFHLGVDQCLIALGLDQYLMFFPGKSQLFNPYSAGHDVELTDKLVGVRVLQMLRPLQKPMRYGDLKAAFDRWGYRVAAVSTQMEAMVSKDLVWTTTGAPADFCDDSGVMLSYRGGVYVNRLLGRAVFNYMVAFDVDIDPVAGSTLQRLSRDEVIDELGLLARFDRAVPTDTLAARVLELANTLYNAERREVKALTSAQSIREFHAEVAPSCISADVVEGLQKFLVAVVEKKNPESRYMQPSGAMMQRVANAHREYASAFRPYW